MVLCLSHDGACTDSFENFREISLKGDLLNDITLNSPLFSLVNTFKIVLSLFGSIILTLPGWVDGGGRGSGKRKGGGKGGRGRKTIAWRDLLKNTLLRVEDAIAQLTLWTGVYKNREVPLRYLQQ